MPDGPSDLTNHGENVERVATLEVLEKPWWKSRAIVGILVAVLAQVAQRAGLPVDPADEQLVDLLLDVLAGGAAAVALYGRVAATRQIGRVEGREAKVEGSQTADRAARGILALLVMGIIALALSGCLVTGSVFYPLPEGGSASVGFTGELPRAKGYAK